MRTPEIGIFKTQYEDLISKVSEEPSPENITEARGTLARWLDMIAEAVAAPSSPEEKNVEEAKIKEIEGWKTDFDKKYP
jgi:hypothetical protein